SVPKLIEEFIGAVNTGTTALSISRMKSPKGWAEPGQKPDFDEYSLVLSGQLSVESRDGVIVVGAGGAVHTRAGEWVRYSTPSGPAEYISVCVPAFTPEAVHRDQ
ncbi:MAG TPA: cupin, partial [Dehalococcoidia bacterium]|nr:cupin [Dehalococcoidia bacterium]